MRSLQLISGSKLLSSLLIVVAKIFFHFCRKGDYYRYLAEFKTGNDRKEVADHSLKAYEV